MSEHSISLYISYLYCIIHELQHIYLKGDNYTTSVTRAAELLTLLEHLNLPRISEGIALLGLLCVGLCEPLFVLFSFSFSHCIRRLTASDYPFGIEQETLKQ